MSRSKRSPSLFWPLLLLGLPLFTAGIACEDPLASFERARLAVAEGKRTAAEQSAATPRADASSAAEANYADDEAARARVGGISLGPGDAKRLYYQFIDAQSRVRFVERLDDVPARWRSRVGFVEMDSPPPLSPAMAEETRDRRYAAVASKHRKLAPAKMRGRIVLYSADWCGWCQKAKQHLDRKGINYEIRDIDHPENLAELVAKTGQKGIPVLDVGGRVVKGFSPARYDELISTRT